MTMVTEYETEAYSFNYDARMGVGLFTRKSDGLQTDLETGSDCESLLRMLAEFKESNHFTGLFDSYAEEYSYS